MAAYAAPSARPATFSSPSSYPHGSRSSASASSDHPSLEEVSAIVDYLTRAHNNLAQEVSAIVDYLTRAHNNLAQEHAALSKEHGLLCDCLAEAGAVPSLKPLPRAFSHRIARLAGRALGDPQVSRALASLAGAAAVAHLGITASAPATAWFSCASRAVHGMAGRRSDSQRGRGRDESGLGTHAHPAPSSGDSGSFVSQSQPVAAAAAAYSADGGAGRGRWRKSAVSPSVPDSVAASSNDDGREEHQGEPSRGLGTIAGSAPNLQRNSRGHEAIAATAEGVVPSPLEITMLPDSIHSGWRAVVDSERFSETTMSRPPSDVGSRRSSTAMAGSNIQAFLALLAETDFATRIGRFAGLRTSRHLSLVAKRCLSWLSTAWTSIAEQASTELYVIGGHEASSVAPCADIDHFRGECWERIHQMPTARIFSTAVAMGDAIYVIGGLGQDLTPVATCERLRPDLSVWDRLPSMSVRRHACGAAAANGFVYVVGGVDECQLDSGPSCERLNLELGRWAPIPGTAMMRSTCVASAVFGTLYVAGFVDDQVGCQRLDANTRQWEQLANAHPPFRPVGLTGATTAGSRLFILGTCVRELRVLDVGIGAWESPPSIVRLPDSVRWGCSTAITSAGSQVYIFGNWNVEPCASKEHFVVSCVRLLLGVPDGQREQWSLLPPSRTTRVGYAVVATRT